MAIKKHCGVWFWTVGRLGGTFYVKRRAAKPARHPYYERQEGAWAPPLMRDIAVMFCISLGLASGLVLFVAGLVEFSNT